MVDRAADHQLHDLVLAGVGDHPGADHLAVAEHRVAVGDPVDLIEFVADEQDRLAFLLQEFDQQEQVFDFLVAQRCRRLVHDDDLRIDRHGTRDRDQMLAGNAEILQPGTRVDACADRRQHFARVGAHRLPVDGAEPRLRCVAEEDVFGDREIVEQHRLLVDGGDAAFEGRMRAREVDGFPSSSIWPASG